MFIKPCVSNIYPSKKILLIVLTDKIFLCISYWYVWKRVEKKYYKSLNALDNKSSKQTEKPTLNKYKEQFIYFQTEFS